MADQSLYIELVVDDKGAVQKLRQVDAGLRQVGQGGKAAEQGLTITERGMLKVTAAGTFLGNALYDLAARGLRFLAHEFGRAIDLSTRATSAFMGLQSVAAAFGQDVGEARKAAQSLANDGLMKINEAALGLKNLLATGFSLPQSIQLMNAFKDAAAFGRQASLDFGYAITSATEGVKNGNSILVDNAGVTKNLSNMLVEAGFSASDLSKASTDARIRMALFNGILRETQAQTGDAARLTQTYTGQITALKTQYELMLQTWGAAITENKTVAEAIGFVSSALQGVNGDLANNGKAFTIVSDIVIGFVKGLSALLQALDYVQMTYHGFRIVVYGVAAALATAYEWQMRLANGILEAAAMINPAAAALLKYSGALERSRKTAADATALAAGLRKEVTDSVQASIDNGNAIQHWRKKLDDLIPKLEASRGQSIEFGAATQKVRTDVAAADEGTKKWAKTLTDLNARLERGLTALDDAAFLKEFGNDLDSLQTDMVMLGKTADDVGKKVTGAFQRLGDIRIGQAMEANNADMREAMGKIAATWEKQVGEGSDRALDRMQTSLKQWVDATDSAEKERAERTLSSYDYQVFLIQQERDQKIRALKDQGSFNAEVLAGIDRDTAEKMASARAHHDLEIAKMKASETSWGNSFRDIALGLPKLLQSALTGGGGFKGFGQAIASQFGGALTSNLFKAGGLLNSFGNKASMAIGNLLGKGIGDAFAMALPGIGSLLGPLAGKLISKLGGGPSQAELEGRKTAGDFRSGLAAGLTEAQKLRVQDLVSQGNTRPWATEAVALQDAYIGMGRTEAEWQAASRRLWEAEKKGPEAVKKAIEEIQPVLDAYKAKQQEVEAAFGKLAGAVNARATAFATPFRTTQEEMKKLATEIDAAKQKMKDGDKEGPELADQRKRYDEMMQQFTALRAKGQADFQAIGDYAMAAFSGLVKHGSSAVEAFTALQPTIDILKEGLRDFNLEGSASISALLEINEQVTGQFKDQHAALDSLRQMWGAFSEAGIANEGLMQTVAADVGRQFAEIAAKGGNVNKAMALQQPLLQQLWKAQQKYGAITDETTASILAQAEEQGIVGEQQKDVNEKILDVLVAIATTFGATLPESVKKFDAELNKTATIVTGPLSGCWGRFEDSATDSIGDVMDALDEIPTQIDTTHTVTTEYVDPGPPEPPQETAPPDQPPDDTQPPYDPGSGDRYHWGGMVRAHAGLAIDEIPIIAQRGEGVLSRTGMRMVGGAPGLEDLNRGRQHPSGSRFADYQPEGDVHLHLGAGAIAVQGGDRDGREIAEEIYEGLIDQARRNTKGRRTRLRLALGVSRSDPRRPGAAPWE